jgi:hypothetical protein
MEYAHSLAVVRDVGAAIAHAHSRGVVHGDINPQNIFITGPGDLRVLDFGASNRLSVETAVPDEEMKPIRFATPGYASCQVLEGKRADVRDDVFALACVAYRLLCGEHPFSESSAVDARAAGSSPRKPEKLSYRQWRVLQEGLHWDREMRPGDVQNWLQRLDLRGAAKSLPPLIELLKPPSAAKRDFIMPRLKILPAALGLVLVVALVSGYWFARAPNTSSRGAVTAPGEIAGAVKDATQLPRAAHELPPAANAAPPSLADSRPVASDAAAPPRSATPPAVPASAAAAAPAPSARPALIEMIASMVEVSAGEDSVRVEVRRKGNLRGEVSFTWWTESGTAIPATDFSPVVPRVAHIGDQQTRASLSIPLINSPRAKAESFYVVIDMPSGNAKLGDRALTMVTLLPTS